MSEPTAGSEGGAHTRIVEEFLRARDEGEIGSLEEFCARYPEAQRDEIRSLCARVQGIEGQIGSPEEVPEPLSRGQVLSHYEILGALGKGGMGEVYRAKDTKLHREVALKVLPPEMASNPERVKRFDREAKAIAALAHPNIVTIHSVEESDDGLHFITMELIEGGTLASRMHKRGMPLEEFFDVAIPMADAISAAHEEGITHRDLKPANIMVTKDGRVKILDFGLAKLRRTAGPIDTTQSAFTSLTDEGKILGTAAYMSPEQAEGKAVDHRTDIFSLGIILYEMATGERPFKGESMALLISSIVRDTPTAVRDLNPRLPNHLGRIIGLSLEKNREHRIQSAKDLRNELTVLKREIDSGEATPVQSSGGRKWLWPAVSGALLAVLLLVLALPQPANGREGAGADIVRNPIQLTDLPGVQRWPNLSPDGQILLYSDITNGDDDIYQKRAVLGAGANSLTEDYPGGHWNPVFDPSGQRIAFRSDGGRLGIWVMDATGESVRKITQRGNHPTWSPGGDKLAYTTVNVGDPYSRNPNTGNGQLVVVDDIETGDERELYVEGDAFYPSWSPSGAWIAFTMRTGGQRDIWLISPSGGEPKAVVEGVYTDWGSFWSPDGSYLYFLSDRFVSEREAIGKPNLWRVGIDEESGESVGVPEVVWAPAGLRVTQASISGDGSRIACTVETVRSEISRASFNSETGQLAGPWEVIYSTGNHPLEYLSVSPDGNWVSFSRLRGVEDVFRMRTDGSDLLNLTEDTAKDRMPTWYPVPDEEGRYWLTFASTKEGPDYHMFAIRPDGTGWRQLTEGRTHGDPVWWPDGTRLSIGQDGTRMVFDFSDGLDHLGLGPGPWGVRIGAGASWSPDGQLIAEQTLRDGRLRIFSEDRSTDHIAEDSDGTPYRVIGQGSQNGNRWLDNHRLIFWDRNQQRAFLWDVRSETATEIDGITETRSPRLAFSGDGKTLFVLRVTTESDIWLLELSR